MFRLGARLLQTSGISRRRRARAAGHESERLLVGRARRNRERREPLGASAQCLVRRSYYRRPAVRPASCQFDLITKVSVRWYLAGTGAGRIWHTECSHQPRTSDFVCSPRTRLQLNQQLACHMQLASQLLLSSNTLSAECDQRCKIHQLCGSVLATQSPMRPPDSLLFCGTPVVVRSTTKTSLIYQHDRRDLAQSELANQIRTESIVGGRRQRAPRNAQLDAASRQKIRCMLRRSVEGTGARILSTVSLINIRTDEAGV
ncbi:hypothetical protein ACVWWO_003589 [Bradyrhizobium sp. F1.13.1]